MTISVNTLPSASISAGGSTTICQGSSVILNANAGIGLTYQWQNNGTTIAGETSASFTATTTGLYTVVVTNSNNCSATSSATTVTVNSNLTPSFNQVSAICSGSALPPLPTTSTNNVAGSWSPALNNTATTTYTFTPSFGQCATTTQMTISVNTLPTVTLALFNSVCDTAGIINLSGGSPAGGTYTGTSVSNNTFNTAIGIGSYPISYSYTNANGCSSNASQNISVISCAGSEVIELKENGIVLYPNPTSDEFTVETIEDLNGKSFIIYDVSGRILSTGKLVGNKTTIQVSSLSTGSYYLNFPDTNQIFKFIKE
jgi:hypothetical protein